MYTFAFSFQFVAFIFVISALELAIGIVAMIYQERMVIELKLKLTDKLQREYGYNSVLTAAIDLAQTKVILITP